MAKRRGGYTGDQRHELKFRASPSLFETLRTMSEETETAMAMVIRQLVSKGLEHNRDKSATLSGR